MENDTFELPLNGCQCLPHERDSKRVRKFEKEIRREFGNLSKRSEDSETGTFGAMTRGNP